jgi:hypothetical protein
MARSIMMAYPLALLAGLLVVANGQIHEAADRSKHRGFLSKYVRFGSDISKTSRGTYDEFMAHHLQHLKDPSLASLGSSSAHGHTEHDLATKDYHLLGGNGAIPSRNYHFDSPRIADKKEEETVQNFSVNQSSMPYGVSAIGVALLSLAAMLGGRLRMRRGMQPVALASSGGQVTGLFMPEAPGSSDNILELKAPGAVPGILELRSKWCSLNRSTVQRLHQAPFTQLHAGGEVTAREPFDIEVMLDQDVPVPIQITPTMADSEIVVAQYPLPFFIDIENRAQLGAVVTKDGSEQKNKGVEKVGDRLRAFTYYEYGPGVLNAGGGVLTMFNSFSGAGYSWNRQLFDATFVSWESSLEKLVTNEPQRTNSVTMVFERPTVFAVAPRQSFAVAPEGNFQDPSFIDEPETTELAMSKELEISKQPQMSLALPWLKRPTGLDSLKDADYAMYLTAGDFGFDPLGWAEVGWGLNEGESTEERNDRLYAYREAELKHGRIAMLAALGRPLSQLYNGNSSIDLGMPSPRMLAKLASPDDVGLLNGGPSKFTIGFWCLAVFLGAYWEGIGVRRLKGSAREGQKRAPGDLGFDPLGLWGSTRLERQRAMLQQELTHGRTAMLAIVGYDLGILKWGIHL